MIDELAHWDDIDVHIDDGERKTGMTSSGHGFIGIGRKRLLNILQDHGRDLGVDLQFEVEVEPDSDFLAGYDLRSEEHTSELQSLMRISYAVFCLKKKNK